MKNYILVLGSFIFLLVSPSGAASPGVYPLAGLDENLADSDLAPLGEMVKGAEIIGLGESVHTSGGYAQAKFRIIKYLVEKQGVRAVGFESPWGNAWAATNYVSTCKGTPEAALGGLFEVWKSTSVRDLLKFLCSFNQAHPNDKVSFFGFDAQQPVYDSHSLSQFLKGQAAEAEEKMMAPIRANCFGAHFDTDNDFYQSAEYQKVVSGEVAISKESNDKCLSATQGLRGFILEGAFPQALSRFALLSVDTLESWQKEAYFFNIDPAKYISARDEVMARNIDSLRDFLAPKKKTAIWAHNGHIAKGADQHPGLNTPGKTMGTYLDATHGEKYFPIGLIGYKVEVNWPGVLENPPLPLLSDSVPYVLHEQSYAYALVDSKNSFLNGGDFRIEGDAQSPVPPQDIFSALLFLDYSFPMKPVSDLKFNLLY